MAKFWERIPQAWSTLRGASAQKSDPLEVLLDVYRDRMSWSGQKVTVEKALETSVALACGRVIAQGIATMPLKLMRQQNLAMAPALEHRLYDRLAVAPNDIQSAFEFKEQLAMHVVFCGVAYAWIPTVSRGIDELYLLEPSWVKVKYTWPNRPTYVIKMPDRAEFTLSSEEVWQINGPSWCTYIGLETTKLARQALGLTMAIEESQSKIQGEGVQMPGFLAVDGNLTEEQQKKLKKWLADEHTGSANAGKWGVVDRAAKFISTAQTNVDAQTLETRRFQIEEVCRFYGVMPIMIGHSDKAATYASAEQMFLAHLVHTIGPWATRIESSADRWLLSATERRAGLYWKFNEKAMIRMSAADQAEYLNKLSGGPIMARNEARGLLDMNPLDGLNDPLTPVNMVAGEPPRYTVPASPTNTPP